MIKILMTMIREFVMRGVTAVNNKLQVVVSAIPTMVEWQMEHLSSALLKSGILSGGFRATLFKWMLR
jgi:hypothetical protein